MKRSRLSDSLRESRYSHENSSSRTGRRSDGSYRDYKESRHHCDRSREFRLSPRNERFSSDNQKYYKTLCVRKIPSSLDSDAVQEYLHNEFSPFGDVGIRIYNSDSGRIALIKFKHSEDARDAFKNRRKARLNDRLLSVEVWDIPEVDICDKDIDEGSLGSYEAFDGDLDEELLPENESRRYRRSCEIDAPSMEREISDRSPIFSSRRRSDSSQNRRSRSPDSYQRVPHRLKSSRSKLMHQPSPEPDYNDPKATRTLFVGSLEPDISETEVQTAFGRYGSVEQVDVKHPNTSHSYAFVRFANVDMALHAKAKMSGNCVRSYHCKIGFGKSILSNSLYISGLDYWKTREELERFLLCFGPLINLDWHSRQNYAVAVFHTLELAEEASKQLKLLSVRRPEVRLVVDFVDPEGFLLDREREVDQTEPLRQPLIPFPNQPFPLYNEINSSALGVQSRNLDQPHVRLAMPFQNPFINSLDPLFQTQIMHASNNSDIFPGKSALHPRINPESIDTHQQRLRTADFQRYHQGMPYPRRNTRYSRYRENSPIDNILHPDLDSFDPILSSIVTMSDLDAFLRPSLWNGKFLIKKSIFEFRCLHVVGDSKIGEDFVNCPAFLRKDPEGNSIVFQIAYQARADATWMVEAVHRANIALSENPPPFCILLALPCEEKKSKKIDTEENPTTLIEASGDKETCDFEKSNDNTVNRPLSCLVAYLRLKQRIALLSPFKEKSTSVESKNSKQKYSILMFTPSSFSLSLLKFAAPRLSSELAFMDDFTVLLVLRN